ncbi:MAG: hypothetical protein LWX70_00145 [Sphingobacteriia bacterium]|nr:hypothetical protein [Sphingobacteriia bacterium]
MLDLNDEIFEHSADSDLDTLSNAFEGDEIHHDNLSILLHNDLSNQNTLPLNDDSCSFFHCEIDDHHTIEESHLSIHHESSGLSEHKSDPISFKGQYNDSEIRHLKDEVSKYQYEVSNLRSEVHHQEIMEDPSKLSKAVSDLNYAIDKLNYAQERLNNAT